MALDTFALGPNPKWYFVNNNGKPLAGGLFNTYSNLNNSVRKNVYTTPSLDFPLPNPAVIDANGTLGPFFFAYDSTNPDDGYLIVVTDANGQVIWTMDDYFGAGGSGGGSTTTVLDINNLINNNVFWRHSDGVTPVPTFTVIAPGNHANLVANGTINTASPDIIFVKNNQSGTDAITFPLFSPLGFEIDAEDPTPVDYFNYTCTIAGTETTKYLQFPVSAKVQNLSNKDVVGSFWARSTTSNVLTLQWFQFYGDGTGASPSITPIINSFNLTPTWTKYNWSDTVPDVTTKTLGAPNFQGPNDGLFLRFSFPLAATSNIDITKLTMYLGTNLPDTDYINYDNIDSVVAIPRTGDVRMALNSFVPFGWVPCNDGVLSNGDGAIVAPTAVPVSRNNIDTYPLYNLIWNLTSGYSSFAPIFDNAGTLTTRGVSAISDFENGKQLQLTRMLGRVLAGGNPNLTASQTFTANAATDELTVTDGTQFPTGTPILVTNTGGALPTPLATANVPNIYYSIFINATTLKLAQSVDLAQAGTALDITSAGSGTNTIQTAVGTYFGEGFHQLSINELPAHSHTINGGVNSFMRTGGGGPNVGTGGTASGTSAATDTTGNNFGHNTMQPTGFVNVMLKL